MAVYRTDDPWRNLVAEHRASGRDPMLAALVMLTGAVCFFYFAATEERPSLLTWGKAAIMSVFAVGCLRWWRGTRRTAVRLYERGMTFHDGRVEYAIAWDDILSFEGRYVPGIRGKGAQDPKNLVELVVTFRSGQVTLPRELSQFLVLVDELRSRVEAPFHETLIPTGLHRSLGG